jgi:hypothetical protein
VGEVGAGSIEGATLSKSGLGVGSLGLRLPD